MYTRGDLEFLCVTERSIDKMTHKRNDDADDV